MKVHMKDGSLAPESGSYFIIAANGMFVHKRTGWVDAIVPAAKIDGLEHQETEARLLLPRITSTVFAKAVRFFYEVYLRKGIESAVLLHYSEKHGWRITIPKQEATGAHVDYQMTERLPGFRCVGTMHSHCAMPAFHSGTDVGDEASQDGIHITIGLLNRFPKFGMNAEFVVNGTRFELPHEHIVRVEKDENRRTKKTRAFEAFFGGPTLDTLYTIPFGILRDWTVPEEWIERVARKQWAFFPVPVAAASDTVVLSDVPHDPDQTEDTSDINAQQKEIS